MADENKDVEYDDDLDQDLPNVFWTLKIPTDREVEIPQPPIDGYIVKITSATFGEKVNKNSRTVVNCTQILNDQSEQENTICILRENTQETVQLDLLFSEMVMFKLSGRNPSEVTLNGYLQPPFENNNIDGINDDLDEEKLNALMSRKRKREDIDEDNDIDNDNDNDNENENEDNEDNNDDNDDNNDDEENNEDEITKDGSQDKDNSNDISNDNDNENENEENSNDNDKETPKEPAIKKRKLNDNNKVEKKNKNNKNNKKNKKNKKMIKLKNGIEYYDMRVGTGKSVKNGNKVTVRYVGQLEDKTVFDKAITGNGFDFIFGKGDVIKGWELGLKNIKVGGKRRLIIPPKFGYGKEGSLPSIPPNSTLTFTIEVMKIQDSK